MTTPSQRSAGAMSRRELLALLAAFGVTRETLAQDPRTTDPRAFRIVLENERVRVLEYRSRPGLSVCGQGMHYHPARVVISLTGAKYKVTNPQGKVVVHEVAPGDVTFSEAVTHSTENIGGAGARTYIGELKGEDWKPGTG